MGAKTKCNLLFVVMGCGLYITIGLIFNVFTIAAIPQEPLKLSSPSIPTSISQRIKHTIVDSDILWLRSCTVFGDETKT